MTNKYEEYLKSLEIVLNRFDNNKADKMDIMLGQVIIAAIDNEFEERKKGVINGK